MGKEDAKTKQIDVEQRMFFFYDENGIPSALVYDGSTYYYQTNLQGYVTGIVNYAGTKVASYNYDAWGNPVGQQPASGVGYYNPLRYRGYVYDADTNWYYIQSRYYDPETGRFLNADAPEMLGVGESVLSYILFSYCENDPVNNVDSNGHFFITTTMLVCAGIGALVLSTVGGIAGYTLSKKWNIPKGKRWKYVLGGVLIGATVGAILGGTVGYIIGPSANSGIVLWSGNGNTSVFQAANSFAKKNGLRILEKTRRGRMLTKMQNKLVKEQGEKLAWEIMKPLFDAASEQFARSANGTVHIFLNASGIRFESTFLTIEYWILREMGIEMVFHFIK